MTNKLDENLENRINFQESSKAVKIIGSFTEIKEEVDNLSKGKYLYIETNLKNKPIYISYEEFIDKVSEAKTKPKTNVLSEGPQVGIAEVVLTEMTSQKPDFKELMDFLIQKININFENDENEIIILSDVVMFLELPWEDITDKEIYVFRKISNREKNKDWSENNLLLLMSHAHENIGKDLKRKMDEEIKGIYELINSTIENEQQSFRIEKVLLSKHTTKNTLEQINWSEYNYVHLIMHGLSDGRLGLENSDKTNYKKPDYLSLSEILNTLKGKNLSLMFLPFCFSGGGLDNGEENLSFQLVKNNASQYVISYSYPVGDSSAASFAKFFYKHLLNGDKIENVYKEALKKYFKSTGTKEYIPFLYMRE